MGGVKEVQRLRCFCTNNLQKGIFSTAAVVSIDVSERTDVQGKVTQKSFATIQKFLSSKNIFIGILNLYI